MLVSKYHALVCILLGHEDTQVKLHLGKISTEEIQATKCARCGRISVLKSELTCRKDLTGLSDAASSRRVVFGTNLEIRTIRLLARVVVWLRSQLFLPPISTVVKWFGANS